MNRLLQIIEDPKECQCAETVNEMSCCHSEVLKAVYIGMFSLQARQPCFLMEDAPASFQ